ncbi:MAG: hypothetical protein FJ147_27710 [Deltaproteobacteria bacterium]|nr:hypothetical protein [Deltaproteobacteria bacterium]
MKRTIIIGDIHGCLAELRELLARVDFQSNRDTLIFLGDYLDRGPDSLGTLTAVRELVEHQGAVALLGNHDEKYLRWHRWQTNPPPPGSKPMDFSQENLCIYGQLSAAHLAWLTERPYFHKADGFIAVHAGISPLRHKTIEDLTRSRDRRDLLLRIRKVDDQGIALKLGEAHPPTARPWWQEYDGRFGVAFYGHQHMPTVIRGPFSVGLDTGCCYGGYLTAAVFTQLADIAFYSVKARSAYYQDGAGEED